MAHLGLNIRDKGCLFSDTIAAVCSIPIAKLKTAYRQNRKISPNSKTHIGNFFAQNDAVYDQCTPSNPLFHKEVFALTQSLRRGGRILLTMRLYTNQDAGNILWEYAFEHLVLDVGVKPVRYQNEIYVNADAPELELNAFLIGEADRTGYRLNWTVEEGSASITPSISDISSGRATALLSVSPSTSNVVKVSASLVGSSGTKVYSETIKVTAGMPSNVSVTASGDSYEQGFGSTNVSMTVRDAYSNLVEDGTPVTFKAQNGLYVAEQEFATNDGVANAVIKGSYSVGSFPLTVQSGNIDHTDNITVSSLTKAFNNIPSNAVGGQAYDISLQVASPQGAAADTYVQLGASGAVLSQEQLKTDGNGVLDFKIFTPSKGGTVTLTAKSGASNALIQSFVASSSVSGISTSRDFVVDATQDTSYTALESQTIALSGVPNSNWSLEFDQYHLINKSPIYFNRFYDLKNDDSYRYEASYRASRAKDAPFSGLYSVAFDDPLDHWKLQYQAGLAPQNPGVSFWLKVDADGKVLTSDNSIWRLEQSGGTLTLTVKANNGDVSLSHSNIVNNKWHRVAFGLNSGQLYFTVDDASQSLTLSQSSIDWSGSTGQPLLIVGNTNESSGNGFQGKLSGLRIYDLAANDLLTLSSASGQYDGTGAAALSLSTQNNGNLAYNTTVAITTDSGDSVLVTVLPWGHFNQYQTTAERALGATVDLDDHVTLSSHFPAKDQPLDSLFMSIVSRNDMGPLESLIVATGWLGMRNELSEIESHLIALQNYYSGFDGQQIVFAMADDLSQALMEAKAGNNMRLISMRTGLLVWGEVLQANPAAAQVIGEAIQTKDDLWTWLRYLSLPANGWAGPLIPIPRPNMTCDQVTPTVNVGTIMEYSDIPCRVTGDVAATVISEWVASDSEIANDATILTRNLKIMIAGLKGAPLEMTKLAFQLPANVTTASNIGLLPDAHANPLAMAARLMVFALKTGAKAGYGNAPANLINFFSNNTTSRFNSVEVLAAIAYLESRRKDGPFQCETCADKYLLDEQVFEQIDKNLRAWFNGLSLAKDGEIADQDIHRRACMLSNQAHGAALELVGTTAYHALYEFGNSPATNKYEILGADQYVKIPLRRKDGSNYKRVGAGNYGRQPDLIMAGSRTQERYWIEFKSWAKGNGYITASKLNDRKFQKWSVSKDQKGQFPHGHKQHFLDYVAAQGELDDEWDNIAIENRYAPLDSVANKENRNAFHRTWVQVWKQYASARHYRPIVKNAQGRWEISDQTIPINRSRPWIDVGGIITDAEVASSDFDLLQGFLAQSPTISHDGFEASVGYKKGEHRSSYVDEQVGKSNATIAPFTLKNMLAVEVGETTGNAILKKLTEQVANSEFADYLGGGDLSLEQIAQLRAQVEAKVLDNLGVVGSALDAVNDITPDWWLSLEESMQDAIAGAIGDDARDVLANFQVPALLQEALCETDL